MADENGNHNLQSNELINQKSVSYWKASIEPLKLSPLTEDISTDVVIVGGGLAGMSVGYCLVKAGHRVALLERDAIGSGETGNTTAHLAFALDDRFSRLKTLFGKDGMITAAQSHAAAVDFIEAVVKMENIDCDFQRVNGYLFLHPSDQLKTLDEEMDTAREAGLQVESIERVPGVYGEDGPALVFPNQGQFHPLKYLQGLCQAFLKYGGKIYTDTHVREIKKSGVTTDSGNTVSADHVVVTTNTPVNDIVTMHTKQHPYRTYAIAGKVPKGILEPSLWWDTGEMDSVWPTEPYHYVRLQPYNDQYDLLISGGEDHKTGQSGKENVEEGERFKYLEAWTRQRFPMMHDLVHWWSGQVMEPVDALGFIGRNPGDENIYIVTGDSGHGMTHCTIAGMLISDLIQEKENPWAKLYDPSRLPVRALGQYLSEAGNMAIQYADYLTSGDIETFNELGKEEGAIMKAKGKRVAVYKDDEGLLHVHSAVCPHLGCSVRWNAFEKTFDCPCHGSRFAATGAVINGPSIHSLKKIEILDEEVKTTNEQVMSKKAEQSKNKSTTGTSKAPKMKAGETAKTGREIQPETKQQEEEFPGYKTYPPNEDIMYKSNKVERIDTDLDSTNRAGRGVNSSTGQDKPLEEARKNADAARARESEEDVRLVPGNEADVTKEDLEALGPVDLSMDMGEDEQLRNRTSPVDFSGRDLDVPGSELDDDVEDIGKEDEENNSYSLGSERHEDEDRNPTS